MIKKEDIKHKMNFFLCMLCDHLIDSDSWSLTISKVNKPERIYICKNCYSYKELLDIWANIKFPVSGILNYCFICEEKTEKGEPYYMSFSEHGSIFENRWIPFHEDCWQDYAGEDFIF